MARLVSMAMAAILLTTAAIPSAYAGISLQGPRPSGIALQSLRSGWPTVIAVTLASGETIDLSGPPTSSASRGR